MLANLIIVLLISDILPLGIGLVSYAEEQDNIEYSVKFVELTEQSFIDQNSTEGVSLVETPSVAVLNEDFSLLDISEENTQIGYLDSAVEDEIQAAEEILKKQQELYNYDKYEPDFVVSTKIHQIVDYVDTGASRVVDEHVGKTINMPWTDSSDKDLEHKISKLAYMAENGEYQKTKDNLLDNMNRNIIHGGRNNLQVSINDYLENDVKQIDANQLEKGKSGVYSTEVTSEKKTNKDSYSKQKI